jgi:hypothetical protein
MICADAKLLCKVLAMRLDPVIPLLVSTDQIGFVRGRLIHDHILSAQMTIDWCNARATRSGALLLLDQEKAFDRVHWLYRDKVLERFGFGNRFRSWITILHTQIAARVLVNGHKSTSFPILRGTRQGDPLSPSLFALVDEAFACSLRAETNFRGIPIPGPPLKILQYADDKLIGLKTPDDYTVVSSVMDSYCAASGARINNAKSELILLGSSRNNTNLWSAVPAKLVAEGDTTRYLGVQIGSSPSQSALWDTVCTKFRNTLAAWSHRSLSLKGKVTVIRALASSKLWFVAAVCAPPSKLISSLQQAVYRFLWNGKPRGAISRDVCLAPRSLGGLDIPDIGSMIQALHVQWLKRFLSTSPAPWKPLLRHWLRNTDASRVWRLAEEDIIILWSHLPAQLRQLPPHLAMFSDSLKTAHKLLGLAQLQPNGQQEVLRQPLFHNYAIRDDKNNTLTSLPFLRLVKANIFIVRDIWCSYSKNWLTLPANLCKAQQHAISSIPRSWVHILQHGPSAPARPPIEVFHLDQMKTTSLTKTSLQIISSRSTRMALTSRLWKIPDHSAYWSALCHPNPPPPVRKIWRIAWSRHRHGKINDLMWKIAHGSLMVGYRTRYWSAHSDCVSCNGTIETTRHLFADCPTVIHFWQGIFDFWSAFSKHKFSPTPRTILFGQLALNKRSRNVKPLLPLWIALHGEAIYSIWLSRCSALMDDAPYTTQVLIELFIFRARRTLNTMLHSKEYSSLHDSIQQLLSSFG